MTVRKYDLAVLDVSECLVSFLKYCPDASEESATKNAMDYVLGKHGNFSRDEYSALRRDASRLFKDLSRKK